MRFEKQDLTSFSGLVLFQALYQALQLKHRLRRCFKHIRKGSIFQAHTVVLLLITHLLLGFRRLRELDYYREDPMLLRLMGLRRLPDVSTCSRTLADMDALSVDKYRAEMRALVIERLLKEQFPRLTFDFDGSVLSTKGHIEGTAVGFNKKKKGARSYYPLFSTVAQTGQFFDFHHRPGNVHDSNGAEDFMVHCFEQILLAQPQVKLESRVDSAFFSDDVVTVMECFDVDYTISVPFERFVSLKGFIENRQRWATIDKEWSYFEKQWKPDAWEQPKRFIFVRHKKKRQRKGPLQLDLFEPRSFDYEYKVIVTNKKGSAKSVILFHNGRGSQEGVFGEAKQCTGLDVIPTRGLHGNQVFTISSMMAHNIGREMQMRAQPRATRAFPKRRAAWIFKTFETIRRLFVLRAGKLTRPQGKLTLTMNANQTVKEQLPKLLEALKKTA